MEIFKRFHNLRETEKPSEDGAIDMIASTDDAVKMWGFREVLSHAEGAIDTKGLRTILVNHDPNQIAGSITKVSVSGGKSEIAAKIDRRAMLQSGIPVMDAINDGSLRGVSVSYAYNQEDTVWDKDERTLFVNKWRMLEASLTPIPADSSCYVRSLPAWCEEHIQENTEAAGAARSENMTDKVEQAAPQPAEDGGKIETKARTLDAIGIARRAESLGLRASDFLNCESDQEANEKMLDAAAKQRATPPIAATVVTVTADEADKLNKRMVDEISKGGSFQKLAREYAYRNGITEAAFWDGGKAVDWYSQRMPGNGFGARAVEVSANFSEVTQLASEKALQRGFEMYRPWSDLIATAESTGDFKTFRVGGTQLGDYNEPAEGAAFTDLTIDDAGANGVLTIRGGIIQISRQALYNDDLGAIMRTIQGVGMQGRRHEDITVAADLENEPFVGATAALALSTANLQTAWSNFKAVTGPAGQRMNVNPRILLVPPALAATGAQILAETFGATSAQVYAANSVADPVLSAGVNGGTSMRLVVGDHLTDANDWYLLSDPLELQHVTKLRHRDYLAPRLFEIDAGAIASRKFRIEYPFQVLLSNKSGPTPIGAYKLTQA